MPAQPFRGVRRRGIGAELRPPPLRTRVGPIQEDGDKKHGLRPARQMTLYEAPRDRQIPRLMQPLAATDLTQITSDENPLRRGANEPLELAHEARGGSLFM